MLYLIATPIGHLSDFSLRAIETCKECDYLLCEDTRRSSILLKHYQIQKPLVSYHSFNEKEKLDRILKDLSAGQSIGVLSDGGTPALCDPGELLVKECKAKGLPITAIPGPCALIQALILSGFPTLPFQFLGFLPKKAGEILSLLPMAFSYPGTTLFYESPLRLVDTLDIISNISPQIRIAVARELSKTYEEVLQGPVSEILSHFKQKPPKGEIVLLIEGNPETFQEKGPKDLVEELVSIYKISLTEAIKTASHLLKVQKQTIYKLYHS